MTSVYTVTLPNLPEKKVWDISVRRETQFAVKRKIMSLSFTQFVCKETTLG